MYRQCIPQVVLWGPTHFAPIIQKTSEHAQQAVAAGAGNIYYVLLILTDGAITDMPQTTNAIVAASHLPISIIIVGVGNADFSSMNILDGDGPDGPVRQPCPAPAPCPIATSLLPTGRGRAVVDLGWLDAIPYSTVRTRVGAYDVSQRCPPLNQAASWLVLLFLF